MKKIFLTGVILLLLIILAVDFYVTRHNDEKTSTAAITLTDNSNSAARTAAVASPATIEASATTTEEQVSTTTVTRKSRKIKHSKSVKTTSADVAMNTTRDDGGLVVIMDHDDAPIAAESTNQYMGFVPKTEVKKPLPVTKRHMVHFGPEVGIMQNCFTGNNAQKMLQLGFHAGVVADIAFNDHLALQPGVRYAQKGIGLQTITTSANADVTTRNMIALHYIEVPANFVVKFGDRENARIMLGAGPYVAYLLAAKDNYETTVTTYGSTNPNSRTTAPANESSLDGRTTVTQGQANLPIGNRNSDNNNNSINSGNNMRQMDWGLGGFVGVETPGGFFVKAGTQFGLANVKNNPDGQYSGKNNNYFVSIGSFIGYRK